VKGAFSRSSSPWIAGLFVALVLLLFFHRVDELPLPHGDEQSFLDVPYRFATFGDLRYPVFMSESFGAADLRPYPPIAALTLRSVAVKAVGFSARNSRYVSGVLIFTVLVGAFVWLRRRFDLPWPTAALLLAPAAFAPVVLIAARNTRLEQEAFFFGALSALLLTSGGKSGLIRSPSALILAGALAALAAGVHPFGVVYGGVAAISLILARRPRDFGFWLAGAVVGALPTVWWMAAKRHDLGAFTAANAAIYRAREKDLSSWLAQFPNVSWLRSLDLPESVMARLASVQHSSFSDYLGFPAEPGAFSLLLRVLFWLEVLAIAYFILRHARTRRIEDHGVAGLAALSLGFLVFNFLYVPNTTYGLYGAFHVHLAFVAVVLCARAERPRPSLVALALVTSTSIAFGLLCAGRLISASAKPTLDGELEAMAAMAPAAGLREGDTVMTSTESWVAAGPRNVSLLERLQYGLGNEPHNALVYRRGNVAFYLGSGLPVDPRLRAEAERARIAALSKALEGLQLTGLLIINESLDDAVYFFRRGESEGIAVASIDAARPMPLRVVRRGETSGPRVQCDAQTLPLCVFHER
jgi:hypothetical protein